MIHPTFHRLLAVVLAGGILLIAGCEQETLAPPIGHSSLAVEFRSTQEAPPPPALVRIVERARQLSSSSQAGPSALAKSLGTFTPDEARIAVLDATQWKTEEDLFTALSGDPDTLYSNASVSVSGDLWDNLVALLRGYTGTTYRFAGEYNLPVILGAGRGVISVNPGLNMFFASLREGRRTVYLYFSIQMINADGENTLILSPFDILQLLLSNVGVWSPSTGWRALDGGINGEVNALEVLNGNLIAGGSFSVAGSAPANNVAQFDTVARRWRPMGAGLNGPVTALALHQGALYALSNSRPTVTPPTGRLFRWDGASWIQIGATIDGYGYALSSNGARLLIGGQFATSGGVTMNNITIWVDSLAVLNPLQGGGTNGEVYAIASGGAAAPLTFVGGRFTFVGSAPSIAVENIARWDTRLWSTIGTTGGVTGTVSGVRALLFSGTGLYVGGIFSQADIVSVNNIAMYNGNVWIPLGGGLDGPVRAMASDTITVPGSTTIYAGGFFRTAEGFEVNNIAVWYGFGWFELGSGVDGPVNAIRTSGPLVYVGGSFRYTK